MLWRVRRKLILSYVFVGVVPVLLVITFFLLAGLLLFFNVSSYLVKSRLRSLTDQAQFLAQTTVAELQPSPTAAAFLETLDRRRRGIETRYPFVSLAIVPVGGLTCPVEPARAARAPRTLPVTLPRTAGPWAHLDAPIGAAEVDHLRRLLRARSPTTFRRPPPTRRPHTRLVMRAVAFPDLPEPRPWAVVLDLPLSQIVEQRITDETGIRIGEVTALPFGSRENVVPVDGPAARADCRRSAGPRADAVAHHPALGRVPRLHRLGHAARSRAPRWRCASTPGRSTTGCRPPRRASAR